MAKLIGGFMGPAPIASYKLLGYNEYQWAHIESLGYKLDCFSDFVDAYAAIRRDEIDVRFNCDAASVIRKMKDVCGVHIMVVHPAVDANVSALDAVHKKVTAQKEVCRHEGDCY